MYNILNIHLYYSLFFFKNNVKYKYIFLSKTVEIET